MTPSQSAQAPRAGRRGGALVERVAAGGRYRVPRSLQVAMPTSDWPSHRFPLRMKQSLFIPLAIGALALAPLVGRAKVADCPPIVSAGIRYSSHGNEVQAAALATGKVLWTTVLFNETHVRAYDPALEEDVQWNIACVREVRAHDVLATDRRKRTFRLDKSSGKPIGTAPGESN